MIKRDIYPLLEKELDFEEVIVLTGMRRVGKTTAIKQIYDTITKDRKLFLDLENPLNQAIFDQLDYDKIKLDLEGMASGKGTRLVVFLDEIQNCRSIPSVVKYLYDHYKIKFFLTGSASYYLKHLFSESLMGRKRLFEMFPLSFSEFLNYKNPAARKPSLDTEISEPIHSFFSTYWQEYLSYGGFPGVVVSESNDSKRAQIADIYTSYFQNEVERLSDFRKIDIFRDAMTLVAKRVGNKIDVSKLSSELGVSRTTILEYLEFLEGTYFIYQIHPYSRKIDVSLRGQKKVYLCDPGLVLPQAGSGPVLENAVFTELRKDTHEVYYYQSNGGAEVDFIIKFEGELTAFEVKAHAHETDVRKLEDQAKKLNLDNFYIVSQAYFPHAHVVYPFQL